MAAAITVAIIAIINNPGANQVRVSKPEFLLCLGA